MADIIAFPRRLRVVCSEISQAQADAAQVVFFRTMGDPCPLCRDTGFRVLPKNLRLTQIEDFDIAPCPCGGTDEDRFDFDFGGAA